VADRGSGAARQGPIHLLVASSNAGKLREYRELADGSELDIGLLPNFREIVPFEETGETFAENAIGKVLHYGRFTDQLLIAEDSGLVVPALDGAPGIYSARYAGLGGSDADCVRKLLHAMEGKARENRRARFVCVIALAERGRVLAVVSDLVEGTIADEPRGIHGFGYDPVFLLSDLGRTSAEISPEEKNRVSHRAKAFRKIRDLLTGVSF